MSHPKVFDKYEKLDKIGVGTWSTVYKGRNKITKELVAIKEAIYYEIGNNFISVEENEREIQLQKIFNYCQNSVKIFDTFKENDTVYIITELCDGDLMKYLDKSKKGFSEYEVKIIMNQLNNILKEMNKKDIVHNDIKLENLLIKFKENSKEFVIKLSDYGLAQLLSTTKDLSNNEWGIKPFEGTKEEMESMISINLLRVGVTIYRMLFKQNFKSFEYMNKKIDKFVKDEELKDLLKKILVEDSKKRISWDEYFNHSFCKMEKIDFDKVENIIKE
jgi:serine/threonine protein kinase